MTGEGHILIVEDEAEMRNAVSEYLVLRGYSVSTAADGGEMRQRLSEATVDLVLLDLGLPGEDGITLTRQLRAAENVGIIIVTAFGEAEDRVLGLESGADDYIVKPFSLRELLARVRSVMRRAKAIDSHGSGSENPKTFQIGSGSYDRVTRRFRRNNGDICELSPGDCDLLEYFLENPDRPLNRDELLENTAHRDWEPFDRSIDVRVARLRRKIEEDPTNPQFVRTVRGIGYLFRSQN